MGTHQIASLRMRKILNSHAEFTTEFVCEFRDGSRGIGSAPRGETISIYEDQRSPLEAEVLLAAIRDAHLCAGPVDQETFDRYLIDHVEQFGRNNCFGLSLAFHHAAADADGSENSRPGAIPRLCLNILNGGWHAYTNPVLCDFSEILLVPTQNSLTDMLQEHQAVQQRVRERLLSRDTAVINGNPVHVFGAKDNREPIEFLLGILRELGLADAYRLMIDASAGDLKTAAGYQFSLTDGSVRTTDELCAYWKALVEDYGIQFLEDPFHEKDFAGWQSLTTARPGTCETIGDNLYSSDAARITAGAKAGYSDGVIIKPNQAGTVTATLEAVRVARAHHQTIIASHRSISTESTYLCQVCNHHDLPYVKIGPLFTDYSSILRLNELIRLAEVGYA